MTMRLEIHGRNILLMRELRNILSDAYDAQLAALSQKFGSSRFCRARLRCVPAG
jgi:hypothetical protein